MIRTFFARIELAARRSAIVRAVIGTGSLLVLALMWAASVAADDPLGVVSGGLTPAEVLTLGGASVVNSIVLGVIITAWKPTADQKDRFGPLLALGLGIVIVVGFALLQHSTDLVSAFLTGILVGGGSMGVHDTVDSVSG